MREGLDATVDRIRRMHGMLRVLPLVQAHGAWQEQEQREHEATCAAIQARNEAAREAAVQRQQQEVLQVQRGNAVKVGLATAAWAMEGAASICTDHRKAAHSRYGMQPVAFHVLRFGAPINQSSIFRLGH